MGAHDVYTGSKASRKSEDPDAQWLIDGLARALEALRDYRNFAGQNGETIDVAEARSEATSRAEVANSWVDALENAGLSKAGVIAVVDEMSRNGFRIEPYSGRSGAIAALRRYVRDRQFEIAKLVEAASTRPW